MSAGGGKKRPRSTGKRAGEPKATSGESHKLWGGRFSSGPHPALDAVNRSIAVDFRLWPFDVRLSRAWARALANASVLTKAEGDRLVRGLDGVAKRLGADDASARPIATDEDIHTLIDRLLHDEAGDVASRLHTGRSRNDQVATATRLWCIDACDRVDAAVRELHGARCSRKRRRS